MKEQRFIELLNLYIDRQISAVETTELETEIQQNPKRQAVYRQYCRIHSATKTVYASFRANATEQPVLPTDRTGVVELFETKRRRSRWAYYAAGGLAAAACLTLVFVQTQSATQVEGAAVAANSEVRPAPIAVRVAEVATIVPVKAEEPVAGPVSLRNAVANTPDYSAILAAMREQDEERALSGAHAQPARVQSLFADGLFDANRVVPAQDSRVFRIQPASAQQSEAAAFQFQR